jgi:hypothetical protein
MFIEKQYVFLTPKPCRSQRPMRFKTWLSPLFFKYSLQAFFCLVFNLAYFNLFAQNPFPHSSNSVQISNQRSVVIRSSGDSSVLHQDSLTIIPNSVQIIDLQNNTPLDTTYFIVKNNQILKRNKFLIPNSSFLIKYRVFPFNLAQKYQHLDSTQISPIAPILIENSDINEANTQIFDKGLEYNGNYTQGVSLGNAQNLVVNQNFNLNLAGKLGDLDILAAMTDNNLPIQAEGNTSELREIDKIFIQLKRKKHTLIAGDYELKRPENTYFTQYFKKTQGINYLNTTDFNIKKSLTTFHSATLTSRAGIGISKGKFSRNILPAQEGNQGPYRLLGNESSGYFVILSGTERVYFDGKILTRGDEHDYVIDYNRGDIQFTPKRLVTKDSRIIVEFEYADQTYLRSTMYSSNTFKINDLRLNFNFYAEQDSKNSTGTQALDSLDKLYLRKSGNDFNADTPLSIRQLEGSFSSDKIQYKLLDTIVGGKRFENILAFSTNPNEAKYTASFTPVGENKGNYVQATTIANGRIYQWIAPDATGKPQGNFEPIKKLTPPNKQQLMTLGTDYQLFKNTKIFTELALSHTDRNRFSKIGDSTNAGFAFFTHLENRFDFGKKQAWSIQTHLKTELTQKHFRTLNPYRAAEFTRDWNITPLSILTQNNLYPSNNSTIGNLTQMPSQTSEQFLNASTELRRNNWFSTTYEISRYVRTGQFQGFKNVLRSTFQRKGWSIFTEINDLNTEGGVKTNTLEKTHFSRPRLDFNKTFNNNLKLGILGEREKNTRLETQTDTLTKTSFYYDLWKFYLEKTDTNGQNMGFNILQRFDYQPFAKSFQQISKINEMNLNGGRTKNENSQLIWNLTYRNLQVADTNKTTLKPQETYLGRIEYNFNAFKNAFYSNTLYEIGSGQEQKLEYQYLKVNKGEGQYIWRNRNTDTIPQLDEFETAPFQDQADYVRVTLFSNQFVRTNNIAFSQSLRFDPHTLWGEKQGILKTLRHFSTNSTLLISKRVKNGENTEGVSQWNPFEKTLDKALVSLNLSVRNSVFFNRLSPIWDVELGQLDNRTRGLFVTGFEERGRNEWFLRSRWNVSSSISLQNYFAKGAQISLTEGFQNRNYNLSLVKIEPELTWLLGNDVRLAFQYKYKNGENTLKNKGERLKKQDFGTEITWNQSINAQFRAKFSYVNIGYVGEKNTPIEFALLEGLQNGRNFLWNLSLDKVLSKNMYLNVNYEARKTGLVRVIHVGRVGVRANF